MPVSLSRRAIIAHKGRPHRRFEDLLAMVSHARRMLPAPLVLVDGQAASDVNLVRALSSPTLSLRAWPASPSQHDAWGLTAAGLVQDDVKGLYEVRSGLVQVYSKPSKLASGEGALSAGTRFFATPFQLGKSRWLLLQVQDGGRALFSPEAKSRVPQSASYFASEDVAFNLYSGSAPLPLAPRSRTSSEDDPLWALEDEQYIRRLRDVHRPFGDSSRRLASLDADDAIRASAGVVAGGAPLKTAHRESKCPRRQRGPLGSWAHTSLCPGRIGASPKADYCHAVPRGEYCHTNFQRHSNMDARYSMH